MNESLPREAKLVWLALQELMGDAPASAEGIALTDNFFLNPAGKRPLATQLFID